MIQYKYVNYIVHNKFSFQFNSLFLAISHCVKSAAVVHLQGVIHRELCSPPVPLVHLPKLLNLVVHSVHTFTFHVQVEKLEGVEEVLLDAGDLDRLKGLHNSLNVSPATAQDIVLLHVPTYISK